MAKKETLNIGPASVGIQVDDHGYTLIFTAGHRTKTGRFVQRIVRVKMHDWSVSRLVDLLSAVVNRRELHAHAMRAGFRRAAGVQG
jgi:hypothetical protein